MSVINEVNNVYHQLIHQGKDVFITRYRCYDIQLYFIHFDSSEEIHNCTNDSSVNLYVYLFIKSYKIHSSITVKMYLLQVLDVMTTVFYSF